MNPLVWLFVVAPAAAVAALLFVWVYQEQTDRGELQREQSRLERQQFDQDFSAAWNGEALEAPKTEDVEKTRARIATRQPPKQAKEQERSARLASREAELEGVVKAGEATPEDCKQDNQQ